MSNFINEIWSSNSTGIFSNNKAQRLIALLDENLNESNTSADISASYAKIMRQVIDRVSIDTSIKHFVSVIPATGSTGTVPVSSTKYVGIKNKNINFNDNVVVLVVQDETQFNIGDLIHGSTSLALGTVEYKETNKLLVKVISGTFAVDEAIDIVSEVNNESVGTGDGVATSYTLVNSPILPLSDIIYLDGVEQVRDVDYTIDNTTGTITFTVAPVAGVVITADYTYVVSATVTTISSKFSNTVGVGGILENYSGEYTTADGELLKDSTSNSIVHGVKKLTVEPKTQKIFTGFTEEYIYDYYKQYNRAGKEKLIKNIVNAIKLEVESRVITYMRSIATQRPDLVLTNSYGVNSGLVNVYMDIYSRINMMIGRIGTNTGLNGNFTVIASSNVVAALQTAKIIRPISDNNSKLVGVLPNGAKVIEDGYSLTDYVMVTMVGQEEADNSAVIVSPYITDFVIATNPNTLQKELAILNRYDVNRSPLDKGEAKTEMIEYSGVDFSLLTNSL